MSIAYAMDIEYKTGYDKACEDHDPLKLAARKLLGVVYAAPQEPFTLAEYNAWLLRLQKIQTEIELCLSQI